MSTPPYVEPFKNLSLNEKSSSSNSRKKGKQRMDYRTTIEDVDEYSDNRYILLCHY